jgi:hypothetical protein
LPAKSGVSYLDHHQGVRTGFVIECENGHFAGGAGGGWVYDKAGKKVKQFASGGGDRHMENFIQAVRSRKASDLKAPIEGAHLSSALCHLANISYRLGSKTSPQELEAKMSSRPEMAETLGRFESHLVANGIDLAATRPVLGPVLDFLPDEERFVSRSPYDLGAFANRLVRPEYRAPYVIPDKV